MNRAVDIPGVTGPLHPARAYLSRRSNVLFLAVAAILVAAHLVNFLATMLISPLGFDEAFNLQAPLNLVQGNGYATEDFEFGRARIAFDAVVSTGPIVELPVAVSFLIFGTTVEAARVVMIFFYALLLVSLYVLGRRVGGRWGGLAAVGVVLALDTRADWPFTVIYGPSDVLGEFAAAALIALALVLLPRRPALAGLALGFAALAKFIALMAVPAFIIAMVLVPIVAGVTRDRRQRVREIAVFVGMALLPSIGWELVKVISLREDYFAALWRYGGFLFRSGSGADGGLQTNVLDRASRMFAAWQFPTLVIIILSVFLFAFALVGLSRYWVGSDAMRDWRAGSRVRALPGIWRTIPIELWAAAGTLGVYALWWSFISSSIFIRHTMPALLIGVPLIAAVAVRGARWVIESRQGMSRAAGIIFLVGFILATTTQSVATLSAAFTSPGWTRAQQVDAARFVRDLGVESVQGIGWWAAPEIRFLSGVPSTPVGTGDGPLVLEPIVRDLAPSVYDAALDLCVEVLYDQDGFVICTLDPDQPTLEPDFGVG